ncbi:MAG: trp operon repressor [Gammaproteobacteria bacterium]|jgi:TrpR family trp operon transcriptional repressor
MKQKYLANWQAFLKLCAQMKGKNDFSLLLDLFLTKAEQEDIALRYKIVEELLRSEKTQREIAREFGVSIAKVTRGSNALRVASGKMKKAISKCNHASA